jgi:hypothetical protein
MYSLRFQICIRSVIRLALSGKTMHPRVPPRLWRSSRTMPGSPRSETPIVDCLESLQRNFSSLSNFREGFGSRIHFPKSLGVGGSFGLSSPVRLEIFIVPLEHLFVSGFNVRQRFESPEVLERCVYLTLLFTQLTNLPGNLSISERHLTYS